MNEKMTAEKAIEQLNSLMNDRENHVHRDDFDDMFLQDIEACKAGIQALEKQIPKKPNNIYCPICKRPLRKAKEDIGYTGKVKKRKADNYCPSCGQALDWSDENE